MKKNALNSDELPLDIVGSSTFGRNPKVLASRTFNMIISDEFLVDLAGYKKAVNFSSTYLGRGIFGSVKGNFLVFVTGNSVYSITSYKNSNTGSIRYLSQLIGNLDTYSGDVFIDENDVGQIGICDKSAIWIYTYATGAFQKATLPEGFLPGYITYQNGRFVTVNRIGIEWALSAAGDALNWFWGSSGEPVLGAIETKPDLAVAALRFPGRGNMLLVFGNTVTEIWVDVGAPGFPYQRSSSVNIDYGVVNSATIAASDNIVAWLGANEKSGPVIMYSTGSDIKTISTDGINYKLDRLSNPQSSTGFFFKLNGHLIYQLTFYHKNDNFTIAYDFTTGKFFDLTDEKMNFHIARHVAFFNGDYYFASLRDGSMYQMIDTFHYYDYSTKDSEIIWEIPRIRCCTNIRPPNAGRFGINNVTWTIEQGNDEFNDDNNPDYRPKIGLSMSKDGGIAFGSTNVKDVYRVGDRANRLNWWNLGCANDLVLQFRFFGRGPWICTNGVVSIYQ